MEHIRGINPEGREKLDFVNFGYLINALVTHIWGEDTVNFTMEYPLLLESKDIDFPIITYQIKSQQPGVINPNGDRERKPRPRRDYEVEDSEGKKRMMREEGLRMDAVISFTVFTTSNKSALEVSNAFMELIHSQRAILIKGGLQNIWFEEEKPVKLEVRETIYAREITYKVVFEKIFSDIPQTIDDIMIDRINVETLYNKLRMEHYSQEDEFPPQTVRRQRYYEENKED